jgi:hypothetical protein
VAACRGAAANNIKNKTQTAGSICPRYDLKIRDIILLLRLNWTGLKF